MHKGLCCVSSQKCTNKWEQVKNRVNELKNNMVGDLQELFTEFLHSIPKVLNNPRDNMKFTVANKNDILTMKMKWHWSEIILDCPKKNIYSFLQCYIFLFF